MLHTSLTVALCMTCDYATSLHSVHSIVCCLLFANHYYNVYYSIRMHLILIALVWVALPPFSVHTEPVAVNGQSATASGRKAA